MQKQRIALEKISQYMNAINRIANSYKNSAQLLEKDFIASSNEEICILLKECANLAIQYELDFNVNVSHYNYYTDINKQIQNTQERNAQIVQSFKDDQEHVLKSLIKNETSNQYWQSESKTSTVMFSKIPSTNKVAKPKPPGGSANAINEQWKELEINSNEDWNSSGYNEYSYC